MRFPRKRWLAMATVGLVLLALYVARERILPCAARWLDVGEIPTKAEYVMVLGGGAEVRPFVAAALVRAGLARKVLLSHLPDLQNDDAGMTPPEYEISRAVLLRRGVPAADIAMVGRNNRTTYHEALALAAFLSPLPETRVLVVTSNYHTRRARWIFRQILGERAACVTFVSAPTDHFQADNWWKNESGFAAIVTENLKLVYYLFRYSRVPYVVGAILVTIWAGFLGRRYRPWAGSCDASVGPGRVRQPACQEWSLRARLPRHSGFPVA
jgi:uncharacterized SAM-binding protein YcdF (DUF218 family)